MIKSVVLCESTNADLEPINVTKAFFPEMHSSVEVLVTLRDVSADSTIQFYWYMSSEPKEPIGIYEIPFTEEQSEVKVVGALDLRALVDIQGLKIYQEWFVTIKYKEYIKTEYFKLKRFSYTPKQSNLLKEYSRFDWRG